MDLDAAGPSRLPSRPETAPWNTIGLPKSSNAVRKAVREIESRLQEDKRAGDHLEELSRRQEEDVPNANQVARTRLLWQAREKATSPIEYRTDYFPDKEPAAENVLILKVEEITPKVEKRDVTVQTINMETIETFKIQSYFNYEKSWQDFRNYIWNSKTGTINSDRVSSIESHIPRIRREKLCTRCRKSIMGDKKFCEFHEKENQDFLVDPKRSRANFFGNSNSFALRCNLNAVQQQPNRRRFYLTPELPKLNGIETFQAKKRIFYRQRLNKTNGVLFNDVW